MSDKFLKRESWVIKAEPEYCVDCGKLIREPIRMCGTLGCSLQGVGLNTPGYWQIMNLREVNATLSDQLAHMVELYADALANEETCADCPVQAQGICTDDSCSACQENILEYLRQWIKER